MTSTEHCVGEQYYLRDSRGDTGSSAMFWAASGGYTTDVNRAEKFSREKALGQYQSRETDIPLRCDLVDPLTYRAVDMQYLPEKSKPCEKNCLLVRGYFDGNNVLFISPNQKTHNFDKAPPVSLNDAAVMLEVNSSIDCYQYEDIERIARRVVCAGLLDTKMMLRKAKIKYIRPKKAGKTRHRCEGEGCGRFITVARYYEGCLNCGWSYCG